MYTIPDIGKSFPVTAVFVFPECTCHEVLKIGHLSFQTFTFLLRTKCFHRTNTPPPHPASPQLNSGHMIPWNVPPGYIEFPLPPSPFSCFRTHDSPHISLSSSFLLLLECLPGLQVSKVCVNCEHKNPCRRRGGREGQDWGNERKRRGRIGNGITEERGVRDAEGSSKFGEGLRHYQREQAGQ